MNNLRISFQSLAVLAVNILLVVSTSFSQAGGDPKAAGKTTLAAVIKAKQQRAQGFVLLAPGDFARASRSELRSLFAGEDPCETAAEISIGQNIGGALSSTDCLLEDGTYADFYIFDGVQGQPVTITMNSSHIDPYLGLANLSGTFVVEDDDGGGGLTARITTVLPETGEYVILANSIIPGVLGGYMLNTYGSAPCTFVLSPATAEIPAAGGEFTFSVNTPPECHWQVQIVHSYISSSSSGVGPGTVAFTVAQNGSGSVRNGHVQVTNAPFPGPTTYFDFTQPSVACTYSVSPGSIDMPAGGGTGSFSIIAPAGCPWSADGLYGIGNVTTGSGSGSGTIGFTLNNNNGRDRIGYILAGGQNFTVNQAGRNCTYNVSPRQLVVSALGRTGDILVDTQEGCTWNVDQHVPWIEVERRSSSGPGRIFYRVLPQTEHQTRSGVIIFGYFADGSSRSMNVYIDQSWRFYPILADFDNDGRSDLSVRRPANNMWYLQRSSAGYTAMQYGVEGDRMTPADYDGDGRTDVAVFRPSNGRWYIYMSESHTFQQFGWGANEDVPVPTDRDGDGKADLVLFRPSNNTWYTRFADGTFHSITFGVAGDKPVVGDFDADGKGDVAVFRPANNNWYILRSTAGYFVQTWGVAGDITVPADYDGDGATDLAVFRPSLGRWYIVGSSDGHSQHSWGQAGDIPVAADYDGDGKSDIAVFRPANGQWYLLRSRDGILYLPFGQDGDVPTPSAFLY